jgi:hypothetical protein
MSYTSDTNTSEPKHFWTAHVIPSIKRLWYFLVSLNSSCWYLFNSIDGIIIETLMCLRVYFILFLFFSLFYLFTNYKEREDRKNKERKKKWHWRHTEVLMMTSLILLERSQQDEFNDIKKYHKQGMEWATWVVQNYRGSLTLSRSCDAFRSPMITLLSIFGLVYLKFFQ